MARLCKPVKPLSPEDSEWVSSIMRLASSAYPEAQPSLRHEAFRVLTSIPHFDRAVASLCLSCELEYELDVARAIVQLGEQSVTRAQQKLACWRRRGLYYPLLVAAYRMPSQEEWLPVGLLNEASAHGLGIFLDDVQKCRSHEQYAAHLTAFMASQDLSEASARCIARVLDRLAILMRVKSNAGRRDEHSLDACLRAFPPLDTLDARDIWTHNVTHQGGPRGLHAALRPVHGTLRRQEPPRHALVRTHAPHAKGKR